MFYSPFYKRPFHNDPFNDAGQDEGEVEYDNGGGEQQEEDPRERVPGRRSRAPDGRRHTLATSTPLQVLS